MGDFNAYTGLEAEIPDVLIPDLGDFVPICCRIPRSNKDEKRKINVWGRKLLAFCGEHGLMIANGRFGKDKGRGEFTCLSGPTPSVVDYVLINTQLVPESINMGVLDLVGSDHRAIMLEVKIGQFAKHGSRLRNFYNADYRKIGLGKRIRNDLTDKDIEAFRRELLDSHVKNNLKALEDNEKDAHSVIMLLNEIMGSCAESCGLTKKLKKNEGYFDLDCKLMKEEAKYLLNRLNEFDSAEDQSLKLANYKDKRREYKSLIKRKKKEYEHKKKLDIADDFRNKDFKKFWGYIKNDSGRRNVNTQAVPEADSWPDYLNNLEGVCADLQEVAHTPEMVIYPMREHDYDLVGDVNGQEIKSIFKKLKGGTAAGVDGIPILLFKNFLSILIPIIVLLCNKVLRSGQWPSAWKTSLFIPLFKRGNPKAHENYRLIALVPALSKVLEKILDTRLSNWLNKNNLIHEEQGGFRTGYGTTDSVFILKALIDKYGKGKTCLYVGFLDLHKAFDSVDRELLKDAMLNIGLPHSFVRLIVSMYTCVSGIIQVGNRFSKLFDIKRGVKQGSTLSPKLFNIFINDVVNFLENRWAPKVSLGTQKLSLLLFADDIALVANKPQDLQTLLNLIEEYLHIKKLRLNTEKSEVVIFKKRKVGDDEKYTFKFNNKELFISKRIKYLGFILSENGSLRSHVDEIIKRGRVAMSAIFRNPTIMGIKNLKMHKRIFNTKILPVIEYGAEIWGGETVQQLESLQLQYYKRVFGLHQTTHSQILKGDMGLFSLKLRRYILMLRFWLKLTKSNEDRLVRVAYEEMLKCGLKTSWPSQIKSLLEKVGMPYLWNNGLCSRDVPTNLESQVRFILESQEIQHWQGLVLDSTTLQHYNQAKPSFGEEVYFKLNLPAMILRRWIQLRANCLPIQNRQKTFDKNKMIVGPDRRYLCPLCKDDDEDLDHFLRKCPVLLDLREIYLHGINLMLPGILQNSNPTTIFRVGVYIEKSLIRRKSFI